MTFREQCALAAMREILRDDLRRSPHLAEGQTMADYTTTVAGVAWQHADAMQAERAKRETPDAPTEPQLTAAQVMELGRRVGKEEMDAACETARREGRDAGLREALHIAWVRNAEAVRDEIARRIDGHLPEAFPDIAALQAETAKLRAVAEAAAHYLRYVEDGLLEGRIAAYDALLTATKTALPGWRTK